MPQYVKFQKKILDVDESGEREEIMVRYLSGVTNHRRIDEI